jgi:hypothetical protein
MLTDFNMSRLLAFALGVVIGVVFGLAPALKGWNSGLQNPLKERSHSLTPSRHRTQSIFVITQTALTLVLLMGAGLLFRTIRNLWDVNPGFDAQHTLTFKVAVSSERSRTWVVFATCWDLSYLQLQRIAADSRFYHLVRETEYAVGRFARTESTSVNVRYQISVRVGV